MDSPHSSDSWTSDADCEDIFASPAIESLLSPDEVPSPDKINGGILVVVLGHLNRKNAKNIFALALDLTSDQVWLWSPSETLLESIPQQGAPRDSQANIYHLAVLLYQHGLRYAGHNSDKINELVPRTIFLVADEATCKGCHKGPDDWPHRYEPMLIIVAVKDGQSIILGDNTSDNQHLRSDQGLAQHFHVKQGARNPTEIAGRGFSVALCRSVKWDTLFPGDDFFREKVPAMFRSTIEGHKPCGLEECKVSVDGTFDLDQRLLDQRGMIIHNPDRPIFTVESPASATKAQFQQAARAALSQLVPPELTMEILRHVEENPSMPKPLWNKRQNEEHLHLLVLFKSSEDELQKLESTLKSKIDENPDYSDHTFELIKWEQHQIRSRRDIFAFWEDYARHDADIRIGKPNLHMILPGAHALNPNDSQFVIGMSSDSFFGMHSGPYCHRDPAIFLRVSFDALLQQRKVRYCGSRLYANAHPEKPAFQNFRSKFGLSGAEALYNPNLPFWHARVEGEPDCWESAKFGTDAVYYHAEHSIMPIFSFVPRYSRCLEVLVQDLETPEDPEVMPVIRALFHWENGEVGDEGHPDDDYHLQDYEADKNGDELENLEKIWEITLRLYERAGMGFHCRRFVVADRQTARDGTLRFIEPSFYISGKQVQAQGTHLQGMVAPTLSGFSHGRVGYPQSVELYSDLEMKRRTFRELDLTHDFEYTGRFFRPDWPETGVLPPEAPYENGWARPHDSGCASWDIFEVSNVSKTQT